MDNGFYGTLIAGSSAHAGIVVIEDNKVRGGDASYLYAGTIQVVNEEVVANLRIKSYTASVKDSFGTTEKIFELSLSGRRTETGFRLTGYSPKGQEITIDASKISNIDL